MCDFTAIFIALLRFCRKGQWDSAQIWLDYSEVLNTNIVSFLSLYALSRKLEAMLLYLNTSKLTKSQKALNALNGKIEMVSSHFSFISISSLVFYLFKIDQYTASHQELVM